MPAGDNRGALINLETAGDHPRLAIRAWHVGGRPFADRLVATIVVFVVAIASTLAVALLNGTWFDLVNGVVQSTETVARGLLFSSWLLLVGGAVVVWQPAAFGFRLGTIREHLALVAITIAVASVATVLVLRLSGSTPYSDASLFIEAVDVPVTEELVFRSVLLTVLLAVLGRLWSPRTAVQLAIVINAIAFGAGHLANLTAVATTFAIGQSIFAVVLGALCAGLMVRTRSVYPAMVLHGAVNAVVVLAS